MRTFWFLGLLALVAACTGGDINYNDTAAGDGGSVSDGGTDEEVLGTFTAPHVSFEGSTESCTSVLTSKDGKVYRVEASKSLDVPVGTYTVTFGDTSLATTASDDLPIHTSPTGWLTITPAVTVTITDEVPAPDANGNYKPSVDTPVMNAYGQGTWTCDFIDGDETTAETAEVKYLNGNIIKLPAGDLEVEGTLLFSPDEACAHLEGQFLNNTQLAILVECAPPESYEMECWQGTYNQRPAK